MTRGLARLSVSVGCKVHDFRRPSLVGLLTRISGGRAFFKVDGLIRSCPLAEIRRGGNSRPRKPRRTVYVPYRHFT